MLSINVDGNKHYHFYLKTLNCVDHEITIQNKLALPSDRVIDPAPHMLYTAV